MPIFTGDRWFTTYYTNREMFIRNLWCDDSTFERIYCAYYGKVKSLLRSLISVEADAEDLAQDVFVALWLNRENIDLDKGLSSYIYTATRNLAYNYLKHQEVHRNYTDVQQAVGNECIESTEAMLHAEELMDSIRKHVEAMPARQQEIFRLSREENFSNQEISELLQISQRTVENQLTTVLRKLRTRLARK
ncbi:MAG: RNA polymerase sigma-70 factor [Prevotellaceae bacterium]|jgi:RNA polymerase sigma-70 factor (ECF subfamily)|nr:RNA polymerase sigma-70 factor [Prevotellaceae bacterium]